MHQTLDFYTGSKKYKLRNGTKVKLTAREIVNEVPRYYGETFPLRVGLVFFANGTCASGIEFDLMEAIDWREK